MVFTRMVAFIFVCFEICFGSFSQADNTQFEKLVSHLKNQKPIMVNNLQVHSKKIAEFIKEKYSSDDLNVLEDILKPAIEVKIHKNGLVQAADRPLNILDDPTHYNAVWLRDTLWVYLGLKSQGKLTEAKKVLLRMFDYLSSEDQLKRFSNVIKNPDIVKSANGAMEVVHIRFDGNSPTFQDVQIGGEPQKWDHKQNDALGLFFDLALQAIQEKSISPLELNDNHYKVLALFPAYFAKLKFYEMEDAGSWEEIEKVNTSSVGLVTSSLERLDKILESNNQTLIVFKKKLSQKAQKLNLTSYLDRSVITKLVDQGYKRIFKQLDAGGESPLYSTGDERFRKADAALLNLIYPAELSRLDKQRKLLIIKIVTPLIGEVGIRRYFHDSYQSGNFWFHSGSTDDTSSSEDFANRGKKFIESTEAQWFFNSWLSKCAGLLSERSLELLHFNRSLAQLTGDGEYFGADGNLTPSFALPESYNIIVFKNERFFAPSPITPLNWAKASLSIALDQLKKDLK